MVNFDKKNKFPLLKSKYFYSKETLLKTKFQGEYISFQFNIISFKIKIIFSIIKKLINNIFFFKIKNNFVKIWPLISLLKPKNKLNLIYIDYIS